MSYVILHNPAFAGRTPTLLKPQCHDKTPFLDFACLCGAEGHIHESQLTGAPDDALLAIRCHACKQYDELDINDVRQAFADMRTEGWIA
jgi:hypothetical protein